jgi:hypothetical protein
MPISAILITITGSPPLERLVAAKDLLSARDLAVRKEAWKEAVAHTEFGQPIVLRQG